ncbi:hypothetical protein CapIbe_015205 [Capra ibex]
MGWWLLHEAKRISRQLNLLLSLASIVIIGLISLGQPWIHFQVPLAPLGDPGFRTIPIDTVFVVRCSDMACLHEYDQNAYLLDFAWAFLLVASVTNFILCIILINIIFSTSSNVPLLDFSNVIITALTGTALRPSPEEPSQDRPDTPAPPHHASVPPPSSPFTPHPKPVSLHISTPSQDRRSVSNPTSPAPTPASTSPSASTTNTTLIHSYSRA